MDTLVLRSKNDTFTSLTTLHISGSCIVYTAYLKETVKAKLFLRDSLKKHHIPSPPLHYGSKQNLEVPKHNPPTPTILTRGPPPLGALGFQPSLGYNILGAKPTEIWKS